MVGLSDKAKGKQKAVELSNIGPISSPKPKSREFTVRFTDGIPDLLLKIGEKESILDVKRQIRQERPKLAKRRLRLIHAGKLLTNGVFLFDWLVSLEERQQRSIGSQKEEDNNSTGDEERSNSTNSVRASATWLHCSVGAEMAEGEEEEDDGKNVTTQIKPLKGFDRLVSAGFSEEDIATFRRTFHSQSSSNYLDEEVPTDDEDYDEHARALEEQWIDSLDNAGSASISQTSTSSTILQGLLIGFFFPLLPFFFLRELRPAVFWADGREQERMGSNIFSKRMQMALVLGFLINLTFGMWRYLLAS